MSSVSIYALADPISPDRIRYIGKTQKPLHRRLAEHVAERNRAVSHCHRKNWVKRLVLEGRTPVIWPIEVCDQSNWIEKEKHWISFFKPLGMLTNGTDGGDGGTGNRGWKWSPEALKRVSAMRKAAPRTPAQIEALIQTRKLCKSRKGVKNSPEHVERMRQSKLGKKLIVKPEQRLLMIERAKRNLKWPAGKPRPKWTEERRQRMSLFFKGRKITWDTSSELNRRITAPKLQECNVRRRKKVIGEDGRIFESVTAAAKALGVSLRGFDDCVKNGWRVKGVYWRKESNG